MILSYYAAMIHSGLKNLGPETLPRELAEYLRRYPGDRVRLQRAVEVLALELEVIEEATGASGE